MWNEWAPRVAVFLVPLGSTRAPPRVCVPPSSNVECLSGNPHWALLREKLFTLPTTQHKSRMRPIAAEIGHERDHGVAVGAEVQVLNVGTNVAKTATRVTLAKIYLAGDRRRKGLKTIKRLLQRNPTHPLALELARQFR